MRQAPFFVGCVWLCCLCVLTACQRGGTAAPSANLSAQRTVTDELGRRVTIRHAPQRIISLAPNLTEIVFALGLENRVVGVTSFCDFPAAAKQKEAVGTTTQPNLERIIVLQPDLVLVTTASQLESLTAQFDRLQIPVYATNPQSVRDVIASIRHIGTITDSTTAAETLVQQLETRLQAVQANTAQHTRLPRVLFVLQDTPLITVGGKTFLNDLLQLAGAASISASETAAYPQFSRETVIARAPEIIIAPTSHGSDLVSIAELQRAFATTPAIQNHRILRVNADLLSRPGPRLLDGLEEVARLLALPSPHVGPVPAK